MDPVSTAQESSQLSSSENPANNSEIDCNSKEEATATTSLTLTNVLALRAIQTLSRPDPECKKRKVSTVRDFPPGCGPFAPLKKKELKPKQFR